MATLPAIEWPEAPDPSVDSDLSATVLQLLTNAIGSPGSGETRLFFLVPSPPPAVAAEQKLLGVFGDEVLAEQQVRVVVLDNKARCYVVAESACFLRMLPIAARLGPPELTVIAVRCPVELLSFDNRLATLVTQALKGAERMQYAMAGMHFDSGDLVELF